MSIYKYSDFEKQLQASGLAGQFSTADMALAQQNPDAGMAILSAKRNYAKAKTPTEKALANAEADSVRKSYGGYTEGSNGGSFNLEPLSPNSYQGSSAPTYEDKYSERLDAALSKVENREPFTYDPSTDPVYQAYDKKYTREGSLATEDVLGKASVMTGGVPSTAAITAAGQTANQYAAAKADIIPTLYQQAFERAMAEFEADRAVASDLMNADSLAHGKYQTELGQYNTDRSFGYGKLLDEIEAQAAVRDEEFTKQQYDDSRADVKWSQDMSEKEYADSLKQQQFDNWLTTQARKDDLEQQKKQNEYTERELARLEANAAIDNAYTQEQLKQLQEGVTNGTESPSGALDKDTVATYDAARDSRLSELRVMVARGDLDLKEEDIDTILPYESWYRLKTAGYDGYGGYESYEAYLDEMIADLMKEGKREG